MDDDDYVGVGPSKYLQRLLREYGLTRGAAGSRIKEHGDEVYVHHSLLRPHGEFGCAGDRGALRFCREIADAMVKAFGIAREEAVGRINENWSRPGEENWIAGLNIAYHQTPDYWAHNIYYGHDSFWWLPDRNPRPRPYRPYRPYRRYRR